MMRNARPNAAVLVCSFSVDTSAPAFAAVFTSLSDCAGTTRTQPASASGARKTHAEPFPSNGRADDAPG